jgi:hypothetical protein
MGALKLETRTAALGREATDSLLNKSEPHQRGFGTAERFQSDPGGMGPGPNTAGAELQMVTGFNPMVVCKATKAQSFSVTCKRFLTNEAIIASKQNLPDPNNPAPNRHASCVSLCLEATLRCAVRAYRYMVKSQFDQSGGRGVIRRPNSRASPGAAPVSTLSQKASPSSPARISRRVSPTVV